MKRTWNFAQVLQIIQKIPEDSLYLSISQFWWLNKLWFKTYIQKCTLSHVIILIISIVYWGYQDNFKPVYLFLRKRFRAHKNTSFLEIYASEKNCCLCCLVLAYLCFVSWLLLVMCFCARKIFFSKNRLEIVLITSVYNTTPEHFYTMLYHSRNTLF